MRLTHMRAHGIILVSAGVAQLVEQLSCKQQVTSSSLVAGSMCRLVAYATRCFFVVMFDFANDGICLRNTLCG